MAQKRMFDKRVVDTDKFMDLPNSTKALYFMAGIQADDKGFFQPRKLQKMCGFTDDDFKVLIAKKYFIVFESGVMVVTDWNKNNYLDKNRVAETEYIDELNLLKLINDKYELNDCLTNVKPMLNQNSIVENSIIENNINKNKEKNINNTSYYLLKEKEKNNEENEEIEIENVDIDNIFIEIPLNDNSNYQFTFNQLEEYKKLYQAIDVEQEIKKFKAWCISNPTKRKTKKGILRAINSWLGKAQDKGGNNMNFKNQQKSGNPFVNYMMNNGGFYE